MAANIDRLADGYTIQDAIDFIGPEPAAGKVAPSWQMALIACLSSDCSKERPSSGKGTYQPGTTTPCASTYAIRATGVPGPVAGSLCLTDRATRQLATSMRTRRSVR